jgi:hypothetical protein
MEEQIKLYDIPEHKRTDRNFKSNSKMMLKLSPLHDISKSLENTDKLIDNAIKANAGSGYGYVMMNLGKIASVISGQRQILELLKTYVKDGVKDGDSKARIL